MIFQITQLLQRASAAHHEFETTVLNGVYDAEWPQWYAQWVIDNGMNDLLAIPVTVESLAKILREVNEQHQQSDKSQTWTEFTAAQLAAIS